MAEPFNGPIPDIIASLFDKMPLIVVTLDGKGMVTYVNPYFYTISGFPQKEVIGKNWFTTFIPEEVRPVVNTSFEELLAKNENTRFENPIVTKSGDIRLISWTNVVMKDSEGTNVGTLSIGEDVTQLKHAEEALLESEEKFRVLSEIAQEGIVIHDAGIILLCNQKFADIGGYTVNEIIGKNIKTLMPPESYEVVKKHMDDASEGCYRIVGHRKDGSDVPVEICSKKITYRGETVRVATIREAPEVQS